MSERYRVSVMGKKASLGKATKQQKTLIKACKKEKMNKLKKTVSKKVTKGYQQTANFISDQASKLKK